MAYPTRPPLLVPLFIALSQQQRLPSTSLVRLEFLRTALSIKNTFSMCGYSFGASPPPAVQQESGQRRCSHRLPAGPSPSLGMLGSTSSTLTLLLTSMLLRGHSIRSWRQHCIIAWQVRPASAAALAQEIFRHPGCRGMAALVGIPPPLPPRGNEGGGAVGAE